jgi:hypothetical protein
MVQSYLVHGSFVEPAQDDDPKDWTGRPFPWRICTGSKRLTTLNMSQLKKAVLKRQKIVMASMSERPCSV